MINAKFGAMPSDGANSDDRDLVRRYEVLRAELRAIEREVFGNAAPIGTPTQKPKATAPGGDLLRLARLLERMDDIDGQLVAIERLLPDE